MQLGEEGLPHQARRQGEGLARLLSLLQSGLSWLCLETDRLPLYRCLFLLLLLLRNRSVDLLIYCFDYIYFITTVSKCPFYTF